MRGSHECLMYIGMQYFQIGNFEKAREFLHDAEKRCALDPLLMNELGSLYYSLEEYGKSLQYFLKALEMTGIESCWIETLANIAHCYRKLGKLQESVDYFNKVLEIDAYNPIALASLGIVNHITGNYKLAIQQYHKSLAFSTRDTPMYTSTNEMLEKALQESSKVLVDDNTGGKFPKLDKFRFAIEDRRRDQVNDDDENMETGDDMSIDDMTSE